MRRVFLLSLVLGSLAIHAASLEYLSLEEMASKSTAIVRGRVTSVSAFERGSVIYTGYSVQVLEQWKGTPESSIQIALPGGALDGRRQLFGGIPVLEVGAEYVLFLWTGPGGLTQIIGLSQGLFVLERDDAGQIRASQAGTTEPMLDPKTGRLAAERPLRLRLSELRLRARTASQGRGAGR